MLRRLLIAATLFTGHAVAVPAPMPPEELERRADLVAEVEVTSTACVGPPTDKGELVATEYRSELSIVSAKKGKPDGPVALSGYSIEWKGDQSAGGAPPTPPLPKGWRGKVHLQKLPGGGWMPVWYNALEEDPGRSRPAPLPECAKKGCAGCTVPGDASGWPLAALLLLAWLTRSSGGGSLLGSSSRRAAGRPPTRPAR